MAVTRKWSYLKSGDFDDLLRLAKRYRKQASLCKKAQAYLAGCVMAGSALEAVLIAFIHLYPGQVEKADAIPKVRGQNKPLLRWSLRDLILVSRKVGWLPAGLELHDEWDHQKAEIGDYAIALNQIRNLVHPARYLEDHGPKRIPKRFLVRSLDVLDVAIEHLQARNTNLLKRKKKN